MKYRDNLIKHAKRQLQDKGFKSEHLAPCLEKITGEIDKILINEGISKNTDYFHEVRELVSQYTQCAHLENPVLAREIINHFSGSYIPGEEITEALQDSKNINDLKANLRELDIHYGVKKIIDEKKKLPCRIRLPIEDYA